MDRIRLTLTAAMALLAITASASLQDGAADAAAKLSGRWTLNRDLSPSLATPGRGGPRGGSRGGAPSFAISPQRGGRGGGGGGQLEPAFEGGADLPPAELAAQRAMRIFQQVPTELTITATVSAVTFADANGQGTFAIDNKTSEIDVAGSKIKVKTRWDHAALKQDLSSSRRKIARSWTIDPDGRLVLSVKVESLTMNTTESRAVFDRQ